MVLFKVLVNANANKGFVSTHGIKFRTTTTMDIKLTQVHLAYLKLIFAWFARLVRYPRGHVSGEGGDEYG